jgi:hypothetical protein
MKKFKTHQRPRRKYRFDIVGNKKALKIWWDSPFKALTIWIQDDFLRAGKEKPFGKIILFWGFIVIRNLFRSIFLHNKFTSETCLWFWNRFPK